MNVRKRFEERARLNKEIDDVEESIVKKVRPFGTGAHVIVPKSWMGRDVRIISKATRRAELLDDYDLELLQAEQLPQEDDEYIRIIDGFVRGDFNEE